MRFFFLLSTTTAYLSFTFQHQYSFSSRPRRPVPRLHWHSSISRQPNEIEAVQALLRTRRTMHYLSFRAFQLSTNQEGGPSQAYVVFLDPWAVIGTKSNRPLHYIALHCIEWKGLAPGKLEDSKDGMLEYSTRKGKSWKPRFPCFFRALEHSFFRGLEHSFIQALYSSFLSSKCFDGIAGWPPSSTKNETVRTNDNQEKDKIRKKKDCLTNDNCACAASSFGSKSSVPVGVEKHMAVGC